MTPPTDPAPTPRRMRRPAAGAWARDVLARGLGLCRELSQRSWARRLGRVLAILAVAIAGSALGSALTPSVPATVGPLSVDVRVVPSLDPGVRLLLPPAGRVTFATHLAPLAVEAAISEVDLEKARALISSPGKLAELQAGAPDALGTATIEAAGLTAAYALVGAVALALLVYRRRWRRTGQVAATLSAALVVTAAATGITFDSDSFAQPRFSGLLSEAPYVATQTSSLVKRLESYRSGLADIVETVTTLYAKSGNLPALGTQPDDVITVLHISDIHLNPLGYDLTDRLVRQFGVDVVVDTGDITTWGTEVESATLSRIGQVGVPYVFVRGNHDSLTTQRAVAANPNAIVLDGQVAEVRGLVFAGLGDPRFTPDSSVTLPPASAPASGPGSGSSSGPGTPSRTGVPGAPSGSSAPGSSASGSSASSASASSASPSPSTVARAVVPGEDPELIEGRRLAALVRSWNAAHPDKPVDVAAFHEPAGTPPLDGIVPLALAGHLHTRSTKTYSLGTRLMIEGSTGGAGFDSLRPSEGDPTPLTATVLYFARSGTRAGQLVAYDEVTVGGFGLASVALDRTVVRPGAAQLVPGQIRGTAGCPTRTPTAAASPSTSATPGSATPGSASPTAAAVASTTVAGASDPGASCPSRSS